MPRLTGPLRRVRRAFVARRRATALATAEQLGLRADELAALAEAELVTSWRRRRRRRDEVVWTLTPLGAEIMGLEIVERGEGRAVWARIETDPKRRRRKRPVRLYGPAGMRGLAANLKSGVPDPATIAQVAECEGLLRQSEAVAMSDPARARELIRKAETIVPKVADEMGGRLLLDEDGGPLRIMNRLVRVDPRMGRGRAG